MGGHHLPNKGKTDSWITPKYVVDALGEFDLDPCECTPQPYPLAAHGYNREEDGLSRLWFGRVWLNPPYSTARAWLKRLSEHGRGTALIFARTETEMFRRYVWERATAILFLYGRLSFYLPDGSFPGKNSGAPSVLVAYGDGDAELLKSCGLPGKFCHLKQVSSCPA